MKNYLMLLVFFIGIAVNAQVKIGDNPTSIDPNAILELEGVSKGFLLPRMTATDRDNIPNPSNALLIYNTTENCINIFNSTQSSWKSICGDAASGSAVFTVDCNSLIISGTYQTGVALDSDSNTITVSIDVVETGTYEIVASSAGMLFAVAGTFTTTGVQDIVLSGRGYPLVAGLNFLSFNIDGNFCSTVVNVTNGLATITGCGTLGALTGEIVANVPIESGTVYRSYSPGPSYTGGGVFGITSSTVNGVRIGSPVNGTFSTTGEPIDYLLTGTPIIPGTTTLNYSVNGFACSFTVPVLSGTGRASAVNCGGTLSGSYALGTSLSSSNTKVITLTVSTVGTFFIRTNTVNGYYFAGSATASATGSLAVVLTAVGAPTSISTDTFTVTVSSSATAFATCTFNVSVSVPPSIPQFSSLTCGSLGMSAAGGINYIKANNTGGGDAFGGQIDYAFQRVGKQVALSSDGLTMAVGAFLEDGNNTGGQFNSSNNNNATDQGAVYVYTRSNKTSNWSFQVKIKGLNSGTSDHFGGALALSNDGNTLVVGARLEDGNGTGVNPASNESAVDAGAAYVFFRSGVTWTQQAYLKATNTEAEDRYGTNVSISGDGNTVVVSSVLEDGNGTGFNPVSNNSATNSGAIYIYVRSGSTWSTQGYLKPSNTDVNDQFGVSLHLSNDGNTLAVGAMYEDGSNFGINPLQNNLATNSGAAYIFVRSGTNWSQQAYIKSFYTRANDEFGSILSLSGDGNTLAVGARLEDGNGKGINPASNTSANNSGAVFTYKRSGTTWSNQTYIKAAYTGADDRFGSSLALSNDGNSLIVSAVNEDASVTTNCVNASDNNAGSNTGRVYLFNFSANNWVPTFNFLKPSSMVSSTSLFYGTAISIDNTGNTIAVGTGNEDSSATGINGAYNTNAVGSGAVVTYTRN